MNFAKQYMNLCIQIAILKLTSQYSEYKFVDYLSVRLIWNPITVLCACNRPKYSRTMSQSVRVGRPGVCVCDACM